MSYELFYESMTGNVSGIKRLSDNSFIPLCEGNSDYQTFLAWNSEQEMPLDLNSTIESVEQKPTRDLSNEIDDLKKRIEDLEKIKKTTIK